MAIVVNKILDAIIIAVSAIAVVVAIQMSKAPTEVHNDTDQWLTASPTVHETATPTQAPTQVPTEIPQYTILITEPQETPEIPKKPAAETIPTETEEPAALYDVPLSTDLQLHIVNEADAYGIDPAVILAMAYRESTYNASAIGDGGNSYGLLQVQPGWHSGRMERLGCTDLLDPFQNVTVAVDYLGELLGIYGSIEAALTAYNRGHYSGTVTDYAHAVLAIAEELRGTN